MFVVTIVSLRDRRTKDTLKTMKTSGTAIFLPTKASREHVVPRRSFYSSDPDDLSF